MVRENTVVFIGHSECYGLTGEMITAEIIRYIDKGAIYFLSGGQGGFDRMCAGCVARLKKTYPHIQNILVIPYLTFNVFDKDIFDEIIYPDGFEKYHFKSAIPARNRYMVDNSAYAICYVNHNWGGAAQTYRMALRKNLIITNLGECAYVKTTE